MLATSSPGLIIFCSLWCLVLPLVAVPSLVTIQERYKAAKLPDYKNAENPHQYCLGQVDHAQHSWKLKNYRKRQFQVGQIRSAGTVFQSLVLLLMYGAVCVVCNIGAVAGLGVDLMTASEQFDQFGSDFFPVKTIVLVFAITLIVSLQLWTMRAFDTRSGGKLTNRNCWEKIGQRAGILPFTNCFCIHELLLILSGDVELNPGPQGDGKTSDTTQQDPDMETSAPQEPTESPTRQSENNESQATVNTVTSTIPTTHADNTAAITNLETQTSNLHLETSSVAAHDRRIGAPVISQTLRMDTGVGTKSFNQQVHLSETAPEDYSASLDASDYTKGNPVSGDTPLDNVAAETVVEKHWNRMKEMFPEESEFKVLDREQVFTKLCVANQQFRGEKLNPPCINPLYMNPLCIRCGQKKKKVINSHIFPNSMLKTFLKVHCQGDENLRFIHDLSTQTLIRTRDYGYPLQCTECETLEGDAEANLKNVYLLLISEEKEEVRAMVAHEKLSTIAAEIMKKMVAEVRVMVAKEEKVKVIVAKITNEIVANEEHMVATIVKVAEVVSVTTEKVRAMVTVTEELDKIKSAMVTVTVKAMVGNKEMFAELMRANAEIARVAGVRAMEAELKKTLAAEVKSEMNAKVEEVKVMVTKVVTELKGKTHRSIKEMWLPYVLINIMYRGVLVYGDIESILKSHKEKFINLWYNALGNGSTTDVRLYVLPLHPFLTNDIHFMNILERLLRNPTPTELYKFDDAGEFLYTNFDCLHLVLPLCKKSEQYFSKYTSANITDDVVFLRRSHYQTRVTHDSITYYYPDDTSTCFPHVLHEVCFDKFRTWVQKLSIKVKNGENSEPLSLTQYTKLNQSRILADMYPDKERKPPTQEPPTTTNKYMLYTPEGSVTATSDDPEYTLYTNAKVTNKEETMKLIKKAIELSILNKQHQLVEQYKKLCLDLEKAEPEELKEIKEKLKTANEKLEKNVSESEKERAPLKIEELEMENEELKKEARKLEQLTFTNKRTERAYKLLMDTEAKRKQLIKEQTTKIRQLEEENRHLRGENKQLKEDNNYATDKDARSQLIITEQIEQIRILTEDNKQLKEKLEVQND